MSRLAAVKRKHPRLCGFLFALNNGLQRHGKLYPERKNSFSCKGLLQNLHIRIKGENNSICIEECARLKNCRIYINGSNNRIVIHSSCMLIDTELYLEDDYGLIEIGSGTQICGKTQLALIEGCTIRIGENCLFSSEIMLRTGDSHSILDMDGKRINPSQSIVLGDHVWVGNRVSILKGTMIADDTIIGTGSIVTKSFPEGHCAIAGNPAKMIKNDINWDYLRR
ncbi:MAG: acyltransferase [Candidatus Limivicinus sp.]|nr:acyltransferase [Candidatus Limivicinus sp.]